MVTDLSAAFVAFDEGHDLLKLSPFTALVGAAGVNIRILVNFVIKKTPATLLPGQPKKLYTPLTRAEPSQHEPIFLQVKSFNKLPNEPNFNCSIAEF